MRQANLIVIVLAVALAMTPLVYAVKVADPDVVAVWLFDEDEKDRVTDLSQNNHIGKINGNVSWIEVPDHPSLQFMKGQDFTVAAYVKTNMSSGDPPMIVAKNYQPQQTLPWYALYYANQAKGSGWACQLFPERSSRQQLSYCQYIDHQ